MAEVTGSAGQILAGKYRLLGLLGRGGMGSVWRAEHLTLGTPVAVKLVHPDLAERPGMLNRFLREAQAAAKLRSMNVVQVLDHGVDDGTPYIAMECLEGESLARRLAREHHLGAAATAAIMTGVCRALARAHRMGIVHRDLKPDNIFIARDEAADVVKVLDFGIAKIIEPDATEPETTDPEATTQPAQKTDTGAVLGTPRYMSPEQARGRAAIDGRSDLWSLAVIAFECLTGRVPFDANVMGELVLQICAEPVPVPSSIADVPRGFDAWFERATQRDPAARFQNVRELADALAEVLTPSQRWLDTLSDSDAGGAAEPAAAAAASAPMSQTASSLAQSGSTSKGHPRRPLVLGATVAVVIAVGIGLRGTKAPGEASPTTSAAPSDAVTIVAAPSAPAAASVTAVADIRRVRLVVLPEDAAVEVDGAPARTRDGIVEIAGTLGSVHRVRLRKDKNEVEGDVSVTEAGAMPPKLELSSAKGSPPAARPAKPSPASTTGSAAPNLPQDGPKPRESFE